MTLPMYGIVFAVFVSINKTNIANCVLANKMARDERMSQVKHIHTV